MRVSAQALCLYIQPIQASNSVCGESPLYMQYLREKGSWNRPRSLACADYCFSVAAPGPVPGSVVARVSD